jgi:hypothetical protein
LGYEPEEGTFDAASPKYNQFEVKVLRPDTEVRYRRGFLGFQDSEVKKPELTTIQRLVNALTSPFAVNDISVSLNTLIDFDKDKKPVLRPLISVGPGGVTFIEQADGKWKASFDLVAMTFGYNGIVVDELSKTFTVEINETDHQEVAKNGFVYDFKLPLKKAGAFQVRAVIRDHETDKIGSANQFVEATNIKKGRLTFSSPVLDNMTRANWEKAKAGQPIDETGFVNGLRATANRQFKAGTVLRFAFTIYNAKTSGSGMPDLTYEPKIYYNGKLLRSGGRTPFSIKNTHDKTAFEVSGMLGLPSSFAPGEYVLQLNIDDQLRKGKKGIADQFIQFEITE